MSSPRFRRWSLALAGCRKPFLGSDHLWRESQEANLSTSSHESSFGQSQRCCTKKEKERPWNEGLWSRKTVSHVMTLGWYIVSLNVSLCCIDQGLGMFPFFFLLHPQINKLLTHSTPTGYTRRGSWQWGMCWCATFLELMTLLPFCRCWGLGTLKRHKPILRPKRPSWARMFERCMMFDG